MNSVMDDLRGNLYVRVFGNEIKYMNFQGINSFLSQNSINVIDILMKLSEDNDYQFTQSTMFMDSSVIIPTGSGFPLNLTVNGTATVDLKASGKMDVMKLTTSPPTLDIKGIIRPRYHCKYFMFIVLKTFESKLKSVYSCITCILNPF